MTVLAVTIKDHKAGVFKVIYSVKPHVETIKEAASV